MMTLDEMKALHDRAFPKGGGLQTADFGRVADFHNAAYKYTPALIAIIEELLEAPDGVSGAMWGDKQAIITRHLEEL